MDPNPTQRQESIDEAAALWVVRLCDPGCAETDRTAFKAWRDEHPRHRVAYERQFAAWEQSDRLRALRPSFAAADGDLLAPGPSPDGPRAGRPPSPAPWRIDPGRRWAAAALLALFVMASGGAWLANAPSAYATAVGERRLVILANGSRVELNTDSEIRVRRKDQAVELVRGEILLEAPKASPRMLLVLVRPPRASGQVEHPGLRLDAQNAAFFNVRLRDRGVEVTVARGEITVSPIARDPSAFQTVLRQGVVGRFGPDSVDSLAASSEDLERTLAWQDGRIVLAGETLAEAVSEFNRYNTRRLVVIDGSIAGLRLGGYFRADDPQAFVETLHRSFGVRIVRTDGETTYLGRG